jgi:hypothetical protein
MTNGQDGMPTLDFRRTRQAIATGRRCPARRRSAVALIVAALALAAAPAASQTEAPDGKFAIADQGGFGAAKVAAVGAELHKGLAALATLGYAPRDRLFPIAVRLMAGGGVSNSFSGTIVLHQLHRDEAPIVHELAHIVAGYDDATGHWTQEGFASFVQDRFGSNPAYPTFRAAHGLARHAAAEGERLPMTEVMADRRRARYFGVRDPWRRWLAYVQSASFVAWLIDEHGIARFRRIYDRAIEDIDFAAAYGKPAEALIAEWQAFLERQDGDAARARAIYDRIRNFSRGRMGR